MNRVLFTIIFLGSFSLLFAQKEAPDVRKGNRAYSKENYTEAEVNYHRALDKNNQSFEGHFNLGDALYKQGKFEEALKQYLTAEKQLKANDKMHKDKIHNRLADTYHNIGNTMYMQQQYNQAINAYQQSLRYNPKDNDTRYNLVKAMQQLKQQQQQQQQQNQPQNQQQNQQDNQNQQQQQDPQPQDPQQQDPQEQDPQQNESDEQQMDKETAEQILQALEQDELDTQEKRKLQQGKKRRIEKEW